MWVLVQHVVCHNNLSIRIDYDISVAIKDFRYKILIDVKFLSTSTIKLTVNNTHLQRRESTRKIICRLLMVLFKSDCKYCFCLSSFMSIFPTSNCFETVLLIFCKGKLDSLYTWEDLPMLIIGIKAIYKIGSMYKFCAYRHLCR